MSNPITEASLQSMYNNYYEGDPTLFRKRELTAVQTISHIHSIVPGEHFNRILDVGAGEGSLLQEIGKTDLAQELYGVEISSSGANSIRQKSIDRLQSIQEFDGYSVPYPDQYFDMAVSIHVLEHVEHERLFLYELKRVAKHIVIEVPLEHTFDLQKAVKLSRPHGHINFYTPETFRNLLDTSGLKCLDMKIFPIDHTLEVFVSGKVKGTLKNLIRSTALSLVPKIATGTMNYMCIAHCVSAEI